jgi:tRNA (guanine37-N1)-methyltransferase
MSQVVSEEPASTVITASTTTTTTTTTATPSTQEHVLFSTLPVPLPADAGTIYAVADFPDTSLFEEHFEYPALVIPVRRTAELRRVLAHVVLRRPKMRGVYATADNNPDQRILVLENNNDKKTDQNESNDVFQDPKVMELLQSGDCQQTSYTIRIPYSDFTVDEILRKLLPNEIQEISSAHEMIGHLAHVNLRDEVLPFQFWIAKVLMDMNHPRIRTVVNKLGSIDTKFRTFGMQVIAGFSGDGWSQVQVKEEGCTFDLDFRQVYWNSRLAGEHRRLVKLIQDEARKSQKKVTVVADLMAGVGPFAVPLTRPSSSDVRNKQKQKPQENQQQQQQQSGAITVYANDLNPASYKYLTVNTTKNKCQNLHCSNVDARAFVHQLQSDSTELDHVIMNLPATAPDFLDAFRGYTGQQLPRIHVHCFAPKASQDSDYQDAVDRCATALGCPLERERDDVHVHVVRDVSPNKNMLCVSFTLPSQVRSLQRVSIQPLSETESSSAVDDEPQAKRLKATETSSN